jgi:hypothetical protein
MPDHLRQIGIRVPLVFCAEIRDCLFERAVLGENSVNEFSHVRWRFCSFQQSWGDEAV